MIEENLDRIMQFILERDAEGYKLIPTTVIEVQHYNYGDIEFHITVRLTKKREEEDADGDSAE